MSLFLDSIHSIYFCTGARNVELLNCFEGKDLHFEYDERMASFKALGATKPSLYPMAICTTSGTAVSQCLSAMLEAKYSELPLVLITGDRPKKLHGTGSPQTIDHEALTRPVRGSYFEIEISELPNFQISEPIYPVHINILVDDTRAHSEIITKVTHFEEVLNFMDKVQKPLFIISHENVSLRPLAQEFKARGIPFYAEVLSGGRDLSTIKTEKKILNLFRSGEIDSVIRIGHTPLSKVWRLLESTPLPTLSLDTRGMSGLSFGQVYSLSGLKLLKNNEWWNKIGRFSKSFEDDSVGLLQSLIKKYPLSEVSTFHRLQEALPENATVYLGNSLVVRFFELTQTKNFKLFGNRGVNGIDGQLATAIGIAETTKENVYCILGDITTYYDLSSMREMPKNLKLIIINNQGGRIFDMLKLDERIILKHETNFKDISQGFNLSYGRNDLAQLNNVQVLELNPNILEGQNFLKEWLA